MKTSAKYYHLTVGAQGQVKLAKVDKTSSTYDVTHKKPAPPNQKFFSSANYKTCRVFWHFDPHRSGDIPAQTMCDPGVLSQKCMHKPIR